MKTLILALACATVLGACSTTALHYAVVSDVAGPGLSGISMLPAGDGCELKFTALKSGEPVQGCLYRDGLIGRLKVRYL